MSGFMSNTLELIGTVSAVVLIAWFVAYRLRKSSEPGAMIVQWAITLGAISFWIYLGQKTRVSDPITTFMYVCVAAFSAVFVGVLWAPTIGEFLASPFTRMYDGGDREPELRPFYSIATAYRKRGNYEKAVTEIRKQLARFPEDFEGWMMLAEVQVNDLHDLPAASETVDYILTLPELAPKNVSYALSRLGDWRLENGDPDAARAAFEQIIERLPDTEEAQVAAQRIAHLASKEDLEARHEPRVLAVPHADQHMGLRSETVTIAPAEDPTAVANRFVQHLLDHPLDNEVREKLALLYATEFKRLDLASSEIEQLVSTPNQTPKNIAHWLNMLADFHVRLGNDIEGARQTLQRIIDLFPKTAAANTANVRMSQLRLELNQNSTQRTIKLGNYEQNIGLKRMSSAGATEKET